MIGVREGAGGILFPLMNRDRDLERGCGVNPDLRLSGVSQGPKTHDPPT